MAGNALRGGGKAVWFVAESLDLTGGPVDPLGYLRALRPRAVASDSYLLQGLPQRVGM